MMLGWTHIGHTDRASDHSVLALGYLEGTELVANQVMALLLDDPSRDAQKAKTALGAPALPEDETNVNRLEGDLAPGRQVHLVA